MSAKPPSNEAGRGFSYQPALDGIRALAVAAVLAYHAGMPWARGGFLGVDAFFVLSGFLITSLLLSEWRRNGRIGVVAFWCRRARRLLPALFLMLLGVAFYSAAFAGPLELGRIRGDALATIAYVANWRPVFAGVSYFDQYQLPSPLRHTWSLGIEEQYYLVWPLLLALLLVVRRVSLRTLAAVSVALLLSSALLMAFLFQPHHDPSRVYYGTDTRAQSLLVGAVLAMVLPRLSPLLRLRAANWATNGASILCIGGIAWAWVTTSGDSTLLYRGGFLMLAAGVAVVITAAVQPQLGPVRKVLSLPPLRALGLISYGVYLWHWPIYMMLSPSRVGWDPYPLFALRVAVTLAVATASYKLLELPIRHGAFRQRRVSWALAPAAAGCVALALVIVTRGGFIPVTTHTAAAMPSIDETAPNQPLRIMVLGDSVGLSLDPGLSEIGRESNVVIWNPSILVCGLVREDFIIDLRGEASPQREADCEKWRDAWPGDVAGFHPDLVVMVFGVWDARSHVVNGVTLIAGTPEWEDYIRSELERELTALTSTGAKLVVLTWPCSHPALFTVAGKAGAAAEEDEMRRVKSLNEIYRRFAAEHPDKVNLIDLFAYACPEGRFSDLVIDGVKLREDGTHFTPQGSYVVARWLLPQLAEASPPKAVRIPR
jgi:peptidoglycan/LPS O-acetylase OafA/YrhL/lysophospholipase L1-like esterase